MDKKDKEDILQEEIDEELERLKKDEKLVKVGFIAIGVLFILILIAVFAINFKLNGQTKFEQEIYTPFQVSEPTTVPSTSSADITQKSPPSPTSPSTNNNSSLPKEYFIPFGSGSIDSTDWKDVEGLQATVDFGNFPNIKEVKFEASVQLPVENQNVSVRLYNDTDKHPVWFSEVTKKGGESGYVVSSPISFDTGAKTYKVQMKSQLGGEVTLGEARLHIYLK